MHFSQCTWSFLCRFWMQLIFMALAVGVGCCGLRAFPPFWARFARTSSRRKRQQLCVRKRTIYNRRRRWRLCRCGWRPSQLTTSTFVAFAGSQVQCVRQWLLNCEEEQRRIGESGNRRGNEKGSGWSEKRRADKLHSASTTNWDKDIRDF